MRSATRTGTSGTIRRERAMSDAPTPWRVSKVDETLVLDADENFVATTSGESKYADQPEECAELAERIARLPVLEAALREIAAADHWSILGHGHALSVARKALGNG